MGFGFKLYRVTTAIALMMSGFFAFMFLSVILFYQANIPFILFLLMMGASFIHSVLSLYLQRSLLLPEIPLKESTPGGIRIMGFITMLLSTLMLITGLVLIGLKESELKELREAMPKIEEQPVITRESVRAMSVLLILPAIVFSLNVSLSFRFLYQWRQQQASSHRDQEEE